jgi:signal transduction histidine kinase/DNA-binding response OmpR family regulator/ligand-binding sensor domain-containing protein
MLQAQSPFLESISIEQGLSQGFVPSICQDDDGFLWFATKSGLNRYDGYNFKVFRNDPFDSLSLNNNEIIHIVPAGDFLFVVSAINEPMLFHRKTNCFYRIPNLFSGTFNAAYSPFKNIIFVRYDKHDKTNIYRFEWPSDLSKTLLSKSSHDDIHQYLKIDSLAVSYASYRFNISSDAGKYFLFNQNSITVYDVKSRFSKQILLPEAMKGLQYNSGGLNEVLPDFFGATWVFRQNIAARFDGNIWEVFNLRFLPEKLLFADRKSGVIWLASKNDVYGLDLSKIPINPDPDWHLEVGKPVNSGWIDQFGILWMGTDALGIVKFSPRTGVFKNYLSGYSIAGQPVFNGQHHLLLTDVRRRDEGPRVLDLRNGKTINLLETEKDNLPRTNVPATENGYFWWISTDNESRKSVLIRYHPEDQSKEIIRIPQTGDLSYAHLKYLDKGQIWIFSNKQIMQYDLAKRKFSIYNNPGDPLAEIFAVEHTPDGTWWIGTRDGLINAKQTPDGNFYFSKITAVKGNRNSLRDNNIKSLLSDPADANILWIGTNGAGMSRLDVSTMQFTHFNTSLGNLPDNVVYGILADDEKPRNLWISTNRGLTRYSPETGFSQFFNKSDGLQDNEFNTLASFKASSGEMFFGGVNGLTVFNPKDIRGNAQPPEVRFTGLNINGTDINPRDTNSTSNTDIAFLQHLKLPYFKNNLMLHFAAMDFTSPERNQYNFYLEGAEGHWTHRGFENSAQYLNLSPGEYTFWLKAANSNGVWNDKPISLRITITPPWYLTWPAYLLYAALFAFAGFLFNQYQLRQRLKTAEAKRLKNLDEFKSRFFTNITHEFRTPLTVILGMTDRLMKERKKDDQPLTLIRRNGENLLRLINQILDLAKLESNDLKLNYIQGDVLSYFKYISESLHSMANAQNVMLRVESEHSKIVMDYDPERLLQIIYNLLSNAIKFTPSGGKVIISVSQAGKELTFSVTDSGIGIPAESLPFVFDRFYQANNQDDDQQRARISAAGGTGIGLALTKELIQAMGGTISVESPLPGNKPGTSFTVKLPMTNNAKLIESPTFDPPETAKMTINRLKQGEEQFENTVLLIEDNPDVSEYLALCLGTKYRLEFAFNGRSGIEKALETIPDLIISDVMMPEKDGFEVCDFLKNDERTSHIPIILLTAKVTMEARIAGLKRGADTYLAKPFHEEELLVWVEQLINRKKLLQARYANLMVKTPQADLSIPAEALVLEDAFVIKFKKVLEENYSDPEMSVETLSAKMGMSRAQLYRKLSSLTGRSITEHLNTIRLEKAKELLKAGGLNISEVAYEVGFNDPKYFGRLFSEAFGQSPSEFVGKK